MKFGMANQTGKNDGVSIAETLRHRNTQAHHDDKRHRRDDAKGRRRKDEAADDETTAERRRKAKKHIGLETKKGGHFDADQAESQ